MAFTAADILSEAHIILQDEGATRWRYAELLAWINAALREIVTRKPNSTSKTVELQLSKGTYQELPDDYFSLIRATRNLDTLADSATGRTGGEAITDVSRDILDAQMPGWQDPKILPFAKAVQHIFFDEADPRVFYVVPGNTGAGVIEAVVSEFPTRIATPAAPTEIASYAGITIALRDEYQNAVLEYVLYRALTKEMTLAGSTQAAAAHYALFNESLGITNSAQTIASIKSTK